ncbi:MAG: DUF6438 domain-containing protein [Flavobacteriales bacterium]|nr:DUF6438 domain-containing protein [Flavobacteriales bacterium]
MTGKIGLWLVVIALVSCRNLAPTAAFVSSETVDETSALPVYFEKTACFGRCPAFVFQWDGKEVISLTITRPFRDGVMANLALGSYRATITPKDATQWNAKIAEAQKLTSFSTLNAVYDSPMVMDLPSTIVEINGHRVVNRYRGPDLSELYALLEQLMATSEWQLQE